MGKDIGEGLRYLLRTGVLDFSPGRKGSQAHTPGAAREFTRLSEGVGGLLIREGLKRLSEAGVDLVFVLGHPGYYPKHGFQTAGVLGFEAPYPIPEKDAGAWMVQELRSGVIGRVSGTVQCCDVLNQPQHWRE